MICEAAIAVLGVWCYVHTESPRNEAFIVLENISEHSHHVQVDHFISFLSSLFQHLFRDGTVLTSIFYTAKNRGTVLKCLQQDTALYCSVRKCV